MQLPLVSCLCVTENRSAFIPWLAWNFAKQDYPRRELVVVDSSDVPCKLPGVTVVSCARGTSVARKRNIALAAARGTFVTWFDDDDWQHPRKLSILVDALGDDYAIAGACRAWFVDLRRKRARTYESQRMVLFTGSAFRRSALETTRFDEQKMRAADTQWLKTLIQQAQVPPRVDCADPDLVAVSRPQHQQPGDTLCVPQRAGRRAARRGRGQLGRHGRRAHAPCGTARAAYARFVNDGRLTDVNRCRGLSGRRRRRGTSRPRCEDSSSASLAATSSAFSLSWCRSLFCLLQPACAL